MKKWIYSVLFTLGVYGLVTLFVLWEHGDKLFVGIMAGVSFVVVVVAVKEFLFTREG